MERHIGMNIYLIIFAGAGIGGMLRHLTNVLAAGAWGVNFPYGTLTVNILGSLIMGLLAGYFALRGHGGNMHHMQVFLTTGILGGYTTFSTFSLDAGLFLERGNYAEAAVYMVSSVGVSLAALLFALWLVRTVLA